MKAQAPTRFNDKALAAELRERLRGLAPEQAQMMREVMRLHAAGDRLMSAQWLLQVAAQAPEHPEVLLWQGLRHVDAAEWPAATAYLARVAELRPYDFGAWCLLGSAQGQGGDAAAAQHSLREAARCARSAAEWLKLSQVNDELGDFEAARQAADALLRLHPGSAVALLQRARCSKALGAPQEAAADCRTLIAANHEAARAWFSLVDLKTVALSDSERQQLELAARRSGLPAAERQLLDFSLGKVLEDAGDHEGALRALQRANDAVRSGLPWDGAAFLRHVAAVRAAFDAGLPAPASATAAVQGGEVIFLVGLPRSGSTLIEQVLASHSAVEGASELPYLGQVIAEESRRRGRPFPAWVGQATADDWARLGQHYLRLSARWRLSRPIATDKLPDNWLLVGAVRAMLPGARVIDCRRDPVETCWSCYKQLFGPGLAAFSYDYASLATYWQACEMLGDFWAERHPEHVRIQRYEALVAEPEAQIRALLAFCKLPFEPGCLNFHTAQRAIRTPSALQVRQPMRRVSTPAAGFGALLDPLRGALAAAAEQATKATAEKKTA
jgi:tetratricopeptide (TPR) repeat protein